MKWAGTSPGLADAALLVSLLLAPLPASAYQCDNIQVERTKFDFGKLKGPHSVVTTIDAPPNQRNTTYTLDLCQALRRGEKVDKSQKCSDGSWVCAISRLRPLDKPDADPTIQEIVPIAGNLRDYGGGDLDPVSTRLKTDEQSSDSPKEGLRLEFRGGAYPLAKQSMQHRAVIELLCDDRDGTEGEWPAEFDYDGAVNHSSNIAAMSVPAGPGLVSARDGDEAKPPAHLEETQFKTTDNPALVFNSFRDESGIKTLRLTWHTMYACESYANSPTEASQHWGFFTWFVILVFLGTAAYLIFGSWLNYNRYGARGWDLLPHGDTIRDIPYLLKDWVRRVVNTLQGSGSRGGYSAV